MKQIFSLCMVVLALSLNKEAMSQFDNSADRGVKLVSFDGNFANDKVFLEWVIVKNETADRFEVERSTDAIHFTTAALVFTSEKSDSETYMFYERPGNRKIYYRLKMYSKFRSVTYSSILTFEKKANHINEMRITKQSGKIRLSTI